MNHKTLRVVTYAGLLNFAAFVAGDMLLGGDALSGKISQGRYYLGNHGYFTEVSHAVFVYSTVHAYTALAGIALAVAAGWAVKRRGSN